MVDPAEVVSAGPVSLRPPATSVELRAWLGLVPIDGKFTRFDGSIGYDPIDPGTYQVALEIEVESLEMSNSLIRELIIGPAMMDIARFPHLSFRGIFQGDAIGGELTMHGETRVVSLELARSADALVATGQLRRADWGIGGGGLIGASMIRLRVRTPNPLAGRHA